MKKFAVYGSKLCHDCVEGIEELKKLGVNFIFLDITENLSYMKKFLALRDFRKEFSEVKEAGLIGIPCIVSEDKKIYFSVKEMNDEFLHT